MTTATALGIRSYKLPWQKCCGSMQVSQWHAIQSSANMNRNYAVCTMHHMLIAAKHNQYCARLIDIVHELLVLPQGKEITPLQISGAFYVKC